MALFMDAHTIDGGVSVADVASAHEADLATLVHREAHGLVADEIYAVAEGS